MEGAVWRRRSRLWARASLVRESAEERGQARCGVVASLARRSAVVALPTVGGEGDVDDGHRRPQREREAGEDDRGAQLGAADRRLLGGEGPVGARGDFVDGDEAGEERAEEREPARELQAVEGAQQGEG